MSKGISLIARLKAAQVEKADSIKPISGANLSAMVDDFVPFISQRTGTQGYKIVYRMTGAAYKGRLVFDYLMLTRKDGSVIPYSDRKLLSRLVAFGISQEQLENFKLPVVEGDDSDLHLTKGAKVKLTLEVEESQDGQTTFQRVKQVKASE